MRAHGRRYGELLKRFAPAGELLDVGAAAGFILQGLSDAGWRGAGLEPNDRMAAFAREQSGLTVHTGSLESFTTTRKFDAVSLIQVVAHFVDPREARQWEIRSTICETIFSSLSTNMSSVWVTTPSVEFSTGTTP